MNNTLPLWMFGLIVVSMLGGWVARSLELYYAETYGPRPGMYPRKCSICHDYCVDVNGLDCHDRLLFDLENLQEELELERAINRHPSGKGLS